MSANRGKPPKQGRRALALFVVALAAATALGQAGLRRYETRYYDLYTDLDRDTMREAAMRITTMAEEYYRRTRGFAGEVGEKLPFYLFRDVDDYMSNGGPMGTIGVFNGRRLMAIAGPIAGDQTWHTVQHEGFHQFVHAVIGGDIPIWANEGLAEYFGEGEWSGDGFYSGLVPPKRLKRLRERLARDEMKSLKEMMLLPHAVWNAEISGANYDQAWSMVHFLAHAEDGKYAKPFHAFLRQVSHGAKWDAAWSRNFGRDVTAFESRWRDWWKGLPDDPTADRLAEWQVATLTSFFARAASQRQYFEDANVFFAAARENALKAHADDWLPRTLLNRALQGVETVGEWSVDKGAGGRKLVLQRSDGLTLVGSHTLRGGRVKDVIVKPMKAGKEARKDKPTAAPRDDPEAAGDDADDAPADAKPGSNAEPKNRANKGGG
ncbi:MAG: DUF1570 domain-containing protein [Phycisphaerae bacterium]